MTRRELFEINKLIRQYELLELLMQPHKHAHFGISPEYGDFSAVAKEAVLNKIRESMLVIEKRCAEMGVTLNP